jgi:ribosomal-protein-alanine N-acetyltransferase
MVHIGYCIGKRWWHRGITSEALEILIKYFFENIGVNRVEARHDPNNPNSGKVMEKCGMKYEGTMKQADKNNQGICDYCEYGVIAEDYFKKKNNNKNIEQYDTRTYRVQQVCICSAIFSGSGVPTG